jgi:uncharacterized caspase-like protein
VVFSHGHALLIGVGTYQHAPQMNVPVTVADAQALARVLRDPQFCGYPEEQVVLLHDIDATRERILHALDELANRAGSDDTVMLFYCGHGDYGDDGIFYLTTHDTRIVNKRVADGSGISQQQLLTKLKALPARRALLVFNACHSDEIAPTLSADAAPPRSNVPDTITAALLATGEGRIIITACREDQYSHIGGGPLTIFAQALVDSLCGKGTTNQRGYISAFDLYTAVYDTVSETVRTSYGRRQEPVLTIHKEVGPFAVALFRGATALGVFEGEARPADRTAVREVSPQQSQSLFEQLQRDGVTFGSGSANSIQGDVVGGDENIGGDKIIGNKIGGDSAAHDVNKPQNTFNISGDIQAGVANLGGAMTIDQPVNITMGDSFSGNFQGAILNIKSQLDNVTQRIDALPGANQPIKDSLTQLMVQLSALLQQAPPDKAVDAAKVAKRVQTLVEEASKPSPDKELVEFSGESLKKAAANIAAVLPAVLPIAAQIASQIANLMR